MRRIVPIRANGKGGRKVYATAPEAERLEIDTRAELIQALIPIGLEAVSELLQQKVAALAGARYGRGVGRAGYARWGRQRGSVYLSDQRGR